MGQPPLAVQIEGHKTAILGGVEVLSAVDGQLGQPCGYCSESFVMGSSHVINLDNPNNKEKSHGPLMDFNDH